MQSFIKRVQNHMLIKNHGVLLLFLTYGFFIFAPFLSGRQRVHDTYMVEIYDYYGFMVGGLFNQGRVFSAWLHRALQFFNPPFNLALAVSVGFSVVFLAIAAYIVYCLYKKYAATSDSRSNQIIAAIGSILLFFNLFVLESMLFFENAIMSLGVLLAVAACALFLRGGAKWYAVSFACMVLSMFCYQPSSVFFPPLVVLFLGLKHRDEISLFVKNIFVAVIVHGGAMFSNFIFLQLVSDDARFAGEVRLIDNIAYAFSELWHFGLNHLGFMPNYLYSLFLLAFLCMLAYACWRQKERMGFAASVLSFAAVFAATFAFLLPMASDNWYITPRSAVGMAGIGGLVLLSIALHARQVGKIFLLTAALFFLIVSHRQVDIQLNSFANQHMDMQKLALLGESLRTYEEYHGITIERIYFGRDSAIAGTRQEIRNYRDLTISMWRVDWMIEPFVQREMGRLVPARLMTAQEMERIADARAAHWFTNGRMVFEDSVVYLIFSY